MNFLNLSFFVGFVCLFQIFEVNAGQCGAVNIDYFTIAQPRIAYGERALQGEWPFAVALYRVNPSKFYCGGTLLSNKHILTAAHCIQSKDSQTKLGPQEIKALLGTDNLNNGNETFSEISEIYIHPDWKADSMKFDADIAILVLNENVSFTNYIRPVCLPANDAIIVGAKGFIVGWGLKENSSESTDNFLRKAETEVLDHVYCLTTYTKLAELSSNRTFCGGGEIGVPYKGDSGGGLFVLSNSTWVQYGVISVLNLDETGQIMNVNTPAVYTNVQAFTHWIFETIGVSPPDAAKNEIYFTCHYEKLLRTWFVLNFDVKIEVVYVATFTGVDRFGQSHEDLRAVAFQNGTLYSLPDGIGKAFTNLKELHVGKSLKMKVIRRSNFEDMANLITLIIGENDIVRLEEDTLWDLPNLKEFSLNKNKLQKIHEKTFEMNTQLNYVDLDENDLESLPRNLFQYNPLLASIRFRSNRLKIIEVDFSSLTTLKNVDFYANECVSFDYLLINTSIVELQSHMRTNCSGAELIAEENESAFLENTSEPDPSTLRPETLEQT